MVRLKIKFSNTKLVARRLRTASGAYLLELLVALFVSGVMATALMTSITHGMRSTQGSQNQVLATWLAKEAMERVRMSAAQYQSDVEHKWFSTFGAFDVPSNTEVQFKVKSTDNVSLAPYDFVQRPLLLDFDSLKWLNKSGVEQGPITFDGVVRAAFADRTDGGKNVKITIIWSETNASGPKSYSLRGAIFPTTIYKNWQK